MSSGAWAWWSGWATAVAVLLLRPDPRWVLARRLGRGRLVDRPRWLLPAVAAVLAPLAGVVLNAGAGLARMVLVITATLVALFALGRIRAGRLRAAHDRRRAEVAETVDLLAAELRSGAIPARVVLSLAADLPVLAPVARVAELGGDVPGALRDAAGVPGAEALGEVAAAWQVAERSGAPVSAVLDRVVARLRDDAEVRDEVRAGVAPARATARLMAVLPLVGLGLGAGGGGDPIGAITGSPIGAIVVSVGAALACLGVAWIDRVATAAEDD